MHEIITLQLGQRSNFLATHFWNAQESYFTYNENEESEIDPNIHFRPGIGADGTETFTPRTVIYDLKGGFGTLRQFNALYEAQDGAGMIRGLWDGNTVTQRLPSIEPHPYQQSLELGEPATALTEDTVRYWSDFNRVFFHPKSIVQLNEYELNSQIMPFENWSNGEDLFRQIDREVDILDRDLRVFAEECDQVSALQVFTGADDAWGGFASSYIDRIRDEYGKTSLWTFALEEGRPDQTRQQRIVRSQNAARTMYQIANQASAYIRLATPPPKLPSYIPPLSSSEWTTSALSAMAIESLTLPSRLRGRRSDLSEFETVLNVEGNQNIYELSTSILSQKQEGYTNGSGDVLAGSSNSHDGGLDVRFSPAISSNSRPPNERLFGEIVVSRGPDTHGLNGAVATGEDTETVVQSYSSRTSFPLLDSFPCGMFNLSGSPDAVSVKSTLSTTSKTQSRIQALQQIVGYSTSVEDRETLYSGLATLAEAYATGWVSDGSDEDD